MLSISVGILRDLIVHIPLSLKENIAVTISWPASWSILCTNKRVPAGITNRKDVWPVGSFLFLNLFVCHKNVQPQMHEIHLSYYNSYMDIDSNT